MKRRELCSEWEELLALRLEDLSPADRASLEAHLIACPACTAINDHYRWIQTSLAAFPTPNMEPVPYTWKREPEGKEELQPVSSEDILERYYDYISMLVRRYVSKAFPCAGLEEAFVVDEIIQGTLIKLYHAHKRRPIADPQVYIRTIVRNLCIDWSQRNQGYALGLDEYMDSNDQSISLVASQTTDNKSSHIDTAIAKTSEEEFLLHEKLHEAISGLLTVVTQHKNTSMHNSKRRGLALLKEPSCDEVTQRLGIARRIVSTVHRAARPYLNEHVQEE